eukprot:TRINITY_DN5439_c0_g1_i3.p1 TRINITY_DN5439_c0_g1~~TRINITY_DN5439_c0_g1_i3.p1  ORF type:complete len:620 (-),score=132.32 TRINITY_DN5439_c0_g1_i3:149-2008(-)
MGLTFTMDMAETDHGGPFPYWQQWLLRALNFGFSFGGAFIFGVVINFASDAVSSRVEGLKQGHNKVIEQNHTLILGWNDRILALLVQICQANESEGGLPIVILADRDKIEMDDWLTDAVPEELRRGSKIVTRSGSRIENPQLVKVAVTYARSIVCLSEGYDPDESDAAIVRCTLALTAGLPADLCPRCHFVVELQDVDNADVAMLGVKDQTVAADTVIPVVCHDIVGRLMVQCAREVGLSNCFSNLLCFDGSECYFEEWPTLHGLTFREACYCFKDAVVVGVRYTDDYCRETGLSRPVQLNPPGDYTIRAGDKMLVLAEDNDTYEAGDSNETPRTPVPPFELPPRPPENILLAGWRRDFDDMIVELDKWVPRGTRLTLLSQITDPEEDLNPIEYQKALLNAGGLGELKNITQIDFLHGDPTNIRVLAGLGGKTGGMAIEHYNSTILLCRESVADGMNADSRVMVTMLVMRHLQQSVGVEHSILVSEIRDVRTDALMSLTKCSDSVVGNEMVAMMIAQISEDRDNGYVFEDLFSSEGMEMHLKDIRLFVSPGETLSFWDLVGRCQIRNMIPIGWVRKSEPGWAGRTKLEQFLINPPNKDEKLHWNGADREGDMLIVISED